MPTRNVVLTDHQKSLVERLVSSGRYQNASEVLREGLRLIEQREAKDMAQLEALRSATRVGVADMEQGRFTTLDSSESLDSHLAALTAKAIGDV
jgi:antitoxin ParD1/3/4